MNITADTTVGAIAAEHPLATRIFYRHQIDFCCGGGNTLNQACAKKGISTKSVIDEILAELSDAKSSNTRWDLEPIPALVQHILETYHRDLDEELPRLESMARKVAEVHGDKLPDVLPGILDIFLALKSELEQHMRKEEKVLFPMILEGRGWETSAPVAVMMHEHESAGAALKTLRQLTNDFVVPPEACNTWRSLWHGLRDLESALHEHIHLENNILFPRALQERRDHAQQ